MVPLEPPKHEGWELLLEAGGFFPLRTGVRLPASRSSIAGACGLVISAPASWSPRAARVLPRHCTLPETGLGAREMLDETWTTVGAGVLRDKMRFAGCCCFPASFL